MLLPAARRSGHGSPAAILASALLAAVFVFAIASVVVPGDVLGATSTKVAVCGANLRTSPTVTARLRTTIKTATKVSVAASVTGGSWRAVCGGKTVSGKTWYRISAINGRSVKSLYGVSYLYAASGLFKAAVPVPVTKYAACPAYLRTSPATTATARTLIKTDTKVTVATSVAGTAWKATCAGIAMAGTHWYRISAVNGTSVKTLYGVTYLYAAYGLFKAAPTAGTVTIAATATPKPTATPTPRPTATLTPTASPKPTATPTPVPTPTPAAFIGMTEGIDVSNWQGTIAWPRVAAAGKRFVYMKASESTTYVDPTYTANRTQARAAGLLVGAYHFAQPTATAGDALAEADHFIAAATPTHGDLLPVLDLEQTGSLAQGPLTQWVQAYVARVLVRTGVHTVIYCSPNFWKTYMGDTTWFAANGYDVLWIAHWTGAMSPTVPANGWNGKGWTFWQYTSDGVVPGITGRVDLNRYDGTDFRKVQIP
jgi:GH25 family lysozyme M1 (1,4-beta-N-acetylmuramidase)